MATRRPSTVSSASSLLRLPRPSLSPPLARRRRRLRLLPPLPQLNSPPASAVPLSTACATRLPPPLLCGTTPPLPLSRPEEVSRLALLRRAL
ncbi:hypothetical protein BCR35DRAFT_311374 [Leucosporidium creatinivorum]|uniref:Uncharacterized protein n=1 Tax=Leucosporidium creatinivorum TaxID=106004 RepID=A0A1Y2C2J4_9BASI|nr:hypothetical protein BCR35DRAFT_311374 [Leucosporidium creatinivorum]